MRRDGKTWVKNDNTFDWLGIYEPINYFPFSTIIFKIRNMLLNMFILILTLKSMKMKQTTINSSIPPTTNLETDFTKYLKSDYPLHLQLIWRRYLMNCLGGDNRLSHCSGIWIHNHLVPIRTQNHLAKLANAFDGVFIMPHTCFRLNVHSVVAWMPRNYLLETGAPSEV